MKGTKTIIMGLLKIEYFNRLIIHGIVMLVVCAVLTGCATVSPRLQESGRNSEFPFSRDVPFDVYIKETRAAIEKTRVDLNEINKDAVLQANSPFELRPREDLFPKTKSGKYQKGVLLIHGLSDSPYLIQPIARHLQSRGFLVRAILLPGHGTVPGDLLKVSYQSWVDATAYGLDTLRADVEQIYLGGFSTGGALSVLQAMRAPDVRGLFLFSPAFEVKTHLVVLAGLLDYLTHWVGPIHDDVDYAKYESFAVNAAHQIYLLTGEIRTGLESRARLEIPVFAAFSEDDITVDAAGTLQIMKQYGTSKQSMVVLYTKDYKRQREGFPGTLIRENSALPDAKILDYSHIAITIPPEDPHYGANGGYRSCLHYQGEPEKRISCLQSRDAYQGEVTNENLQRGILRRLSYNPRFAVMMGHLDRFLESISARP